MEIEIKQKNKQIEKEPEKADHEKIGSHDPIGTKKCNSFAKLFDFKEFR